MALSPSAGTRLETTGNCDVYNLLTHKWWPLLPLCRGLVPSAREGWSLPHQPLRCSSGWLPRSWQVQSFLFHGCTPGASIIFALVDSTRSGYKKCSLAFCDQSMSLSTQIAEHQKPQLSDHWNVILSIPQTVVSKCFYHAPKSGKKIMHQ